MSRHHIYSNASNQTQDITAWCRLYQWSATTDAKEGSTSHSTLVVDDPDAIWDFVGHRRLYTYEDLAAASNRIMHNGFIAGIKVSRGPYRNGAGRVWTLDLADHNTLLHRRIMNGEDASRPAETDVARLEALIGLGGNTAMTELNTIDDSLYFSGVSPIAMDAVDYRTQPVGTGYINDCAQASGKNHFVWYREATGEYSFWYDFSSSSNWSSTKRLSNVLADVDGSTTFAVDMETDAELDRDPSRVASGIMLPFDGVAQGSNTVSGTVYVQNPITTATFAPIDWLAPAINVKTKTKAEARARRYLADAATMDDLIHCSVKLPAAHVNDILAGQRVEAKFSHLPGYEDFTWMRCLTRTVTEISEDPTRAYRLDLELDPVQAGPCPGITLTPSGFYRPLGGIPPLYASDVTFYRIGGSPVYPRPADHSTDNWHFPAFNNADVTLPAGEGDVAWAGSSNEADSYIVGPGTATIHTGSAFGGGGGTYTLDVYKGNSGTLAYDLETSYGPFAAGVDTEIVLPDDGNCLRMIRFTMLGTPNVDWTTWGGLTWAGTYA